MKFKVIKLFNFNLYRICFNSEADWLTYLKNRLEFFYNWLTNYSFEIDKPIHKHF